MNRKAAIPLVLGLVIGLVAVKLVLDSVKRAQGANQAQEKFTIVQAKLDIGAFEEITQEMVQQIQISDAALAPPQERISTTELAIGRVTGKPIPQNAPVLNSMLAPEGTKARMVGRIPAGYRAVSVKIDEVTGVAYQMQAGDWVDVIVVMDLDMGARGKKETIAETILQHVQVAAVGYGTGNDAETSKDSKVKPAKSATLLVREEDVPKLHLAATRGKVTLAMRGDDDKLNDSLPVAYSSEIGAPNAQPAPMPATASTTGIAAAPVPPPVEEMEEMPHTIFVYRGSPDGGPSTMNVERITFEGPKSSNILEVQVGNPTRESGMMTPQRHRRNAASGTAAPQGGSYIQPSALPVSDNAPPGFPNNEDYDRTEDNPKSQPEGE